MPSLSEHLLECEKKLLDPALRRIPEKLASLLTDDFVEFGSSGRTFDKSQVLYHLGRQLPPELSIDEFRVVELATGVALVTYRARADSGKAFARRDARRARFRKRQERAVLVTQFGLGAAGR